VYSGSFQLMVRFEHNVLAMNGQDDEGRTRDDTNKLLTGTELTAKSVDETFSHSIM
jgi:hypothetical protein